jgi:hypothetical protein
MTTKTLIEKVTDWTRRLAGARNGVQELHGLDAALRGALAELEAERGRLLSSKPPKAEALNALDVELPKLAAEWMAQRGMGVVASLAGAVNVTPAGEIRGIVRHSSLADEVGGLSLSALAAIAPDMVREGLTAMIARTPYEEGPPMADRAALVAEVDRKIEAIVKAHRELVDDAEKMRITLAHLPVTVGRRTQAAQARQRWQADQVANRDYYKRNPSASPPEPEAAQ